MYTSKEQAIVSEIIVPYHPRFKNSRDRSADIISNPLDYKIERLVEQALAAVGNYKWIDAEHADFSDGSDSKTASIRVNPSAPGSVSHNGEVSNVETSGGGRKLGALRTVIWNPHKGNLMYYFLPKDFWSEKITTHPSSGIGKIIFAYNREKDYIKKFEGMNVTTFRQLARA
jgi:hypothetical protein